MEGLVVPLALACAAVGGFIVNEWSHGGLAEAMGLGHHHALDFDGTHCTGYGGPPGAMHTGTPHVACAGAGAGAGP